MYAHEATLMVGTPDGRVAHYINGIQYDPKTVRLSLVEASDGEVGSVIDKVQLFCFSYDPDKGEYTRDAMKIMRAGGLLTMVLLAGTIGLFIRRARRHQRQTSSQEPTAAP
jgi:protein SCO1/2